MSRILDAIGRLLPARAPAPSRSGEPRPAPSARSSPGSRSASRCGARAIHRLRARRLHAERHRLSQRAHDRRGRRLGAAAALRWRRRDRGSCAARSHRRPSPDQTSADFLEAWYGFLLVAGNAYVEAVGVSGRLRELHVLRPDRMKVIPGPDGWPEAFEYTVNGTPCALPRSRRPACARCCTRACSTPTTITTA